MARRTLLMLTVGDTVYCEGGYYIIGGYDGNSWDVDEYQPLTIEDEDGDILLTDEYELAESYSLTDYDLLDDVRTWGVGPVQIPQDTWCPSGFQGLNFVPSAREELVNFVASCLYGEDAHQISLDDAYYTIRRWEDEDIELPEDITPESLYLEWNRQVKQQK